MNEYEEYLEELSKELRAQELVCPYCGITHDSREEHEWHMENCPYKEALEEKAEKLAKTEEPKKALEKIKENIKKEILATASKRQLKQFEQDPQTLENLTKEKMIELALKHPMLTENEEMILASLRRDQQTEVENKLRIGYCSACGQTFGSPNALLRHLEEQSKISEEHRRYKKYLDMVMTPLDKVAEAFREEEKKEEYGYPYYGYEYATYVCPVCHKRFPDLQRLKVHWAREHQMKYGEFPYQRFSEHLGKEEENRKRQESLFILRALLRNKK